MAVTVTSSSSCQLVCLSVCHCVSHSGMLFGLHVLSKHQSQGQQCHTAKVHVPYFTASCTVCKTKAPKLARPKLCQTFKRQGCAGKAGQLNDRSVPSEQSTSTACRCIAPNWNTRKHCNHLNSKLAKQNWNESSMEQQMTTLCGHGKAMITCTSYHPVVRCCGLPQHST